jgi:putative sigma-54 modulation protein
MDLTFTGRGMHVTEEVRETAEHKLASLARLEPRTTRVDLEFIAEHYRRDGATRVEAALYVPRKTFRAVAEADDVPSALDLVVDRLERQIRDHHGRRKKRPAKGNALESARPDSEPADTAGEESEESRGKA